MRREDAGGRMSTGGEVANALVCKTSIRGFNSRPVLHTIDSLLFCMCAVNLPKRYDHPQLALSN
jgi:hypothetical protein